MDLLIILTLFTAAVGAVGFGILLRKLAAGPGTLPVTAEWIDELSMERYRPMLRLLSEEDLQFLASQPGYSPKLARQFRAQRCEIFRGYLGWLRSDFERVCTAIRLLMVQSRNDRPDLAVFLVRQKAMFFAGLLQIHCRLYLYRFGVAGVNVSGLMQTFDSLRVELRHLVPVTAGAEQ